MTVQLPRHNGQNLLTMCPLYVPSSCALVLLCFCCRVCKIAPHAAGDHGDEQGVGARVGDYFVLLCDSSKSKGGRTTVVVVEWLFHCRCCIVGSPPWVHHSTPNICRTAALQLRYDVGVLHDGFGVPHNSAGVLHDGQL